MAVIDSCPRSATAVVLRDDTKIREIPSEEIREIEKNDRLAGREDLIARMRKFAGVHKRNKKPVDS